MKGIKEFKPLIRLLGKEKKKLIIASLIYTFMRIL